MRTLVSRAVFLSVLALIPLSTILDGSRAEFVYTGFAVFIQSLMLIFLLMGFDPQRHRSAIVPFSRFWIALAVWLVISFVQAFSLAGFDNYDRAASVYEITMYFSYAGFLLLLVLLLDSYRRIRILIAIVVLTAVIQVLFGMYNFYHGQPPFGWKPPLHSGIRVTGSFLNRNFFANWIAMALGFVLVPLLIRRKARSAGDRKVPGTRWQLPSLLWNLMVSTVLISGLAMSASRGGMISVALSVLLVVVVSVYSPQASVRYAWLLAALVFSFVLTGFDLARERFGSIFSDSSGRVQQWSATMDMIRQKWIAGYGPGSYETAYKTGIPLSASPLTHDHAHNDYLELMFEQGVLGAAPLLFFIGFALVFGVNRIRRTRSYNKTLLLMSALFGIIAMLVHGLFDFPFQIPSNVLLFLALLAILLSCGKMQYRPARSRSAQSRTVKPVPTHA